MTIKRHVDIPSSPNSNSTSRSTSSIVPSSSSSSVGSPSSMSRRLNGWFAHTFSGSTTDLSLPSILSNSPSPSSKSRSVLLTAAKSGKGHLDKAVRYLLDSDSTPDKCTESIWILGVEHSGWEPPPPPSSFSASSHGHGRRSSLDFRSSTSSLDSTHHKGSKEKEKDPSANWPAEFYADFTSRVWLTYRSHFTPIRDGRLGDLMEPCGIPDVSSVKSGRIKSGGYGSDSSSSASSPTATLKKWNWGGVVGGERGWTTDSGWGCMLRTGQSLLANALVHCHLGREWRRPPHPQRTPSYATYVQIVTWFLDAPSPEAPFSVHRMALAGKELGKDVGQWFGPSTAAGAIKTLVHAFPESGLGVALSEDGSLYESDVYAASWSGRRRQDGREWGDRPVLVLLGIRLGLDGVNPIYYDTIKLLYTFPQSVGIAGGRPSSSYYFVGSQADNLFYLDPHHARPTVPLRLPTDDNGLSSLPVDDFSDEAFSANESVGVKGKRTKKGKEKERQLSGGSTTSTGSRSSSIRSHAPSPLRLHHSTNTNTGTAELTLEDLAGSGRRPSLAKEPGDDLTPLQAHYVSAYSPAELKTFHCERIRKMPLSGLDPSMLIGFLCRNDQEWKDLRNRVGKLPRTIFSIQDERPSWGLDDDVMGMESMSDPDEEARSHLSIDEEDDEDDFELGRGDDEKLFAESRSSTSTHEGDTEEDPVDPITPGPGGRFVIPDMSKSGDSVSVVVEALDDVEDEDDDDDWATPSQSQSYAPTPMHSPTPSQSSSSQAPSSVPSSISSRSSASLPPPPPIPPQKKKKKKGNGKEQPVPVPMVKFPGGGGGGQDSMGDSTFAGERQRRQSIKVIKMHSQRGKDGGRTQSGGVKGVLTGD